MLAWFFQRHLRAEATVTLLDNLRGTVFTVGDHAYRKGTGYSAVVAGNVHRATLRLIPR